MATLIFNGKRLTNGSGLHLSYVQPEASSTLLGGTSPSSLVLKSVNDGVSFTNEGAIYNTSINLITGWTNGSTGVDFNTFISDGVNITSAISLGVHVAQALSTISVVTGQTYKFIIDLTINSGYVPKMSVNWGVDIILVNGLNEVYIFFERKPLNLQFSG